MKKILHYACFLYSFRGLFWGFGFVVIATFSLAVLFHTGVVSEPFFVDIALAVKYLFFLFLLYFLISCVLAFLVGIIQCIRKKSFSWDKLGSAILKRGLIFILSLGIGFWLGAHHFFTDTHCRGAHYYFLGKPKEIDCRPYSVGYQFRFAQPLYFAQRWTYIQPGQPKFMGGSIIDGDQQKQFQVENPSNIHTSWKHVHDRFLWMESGKTTFGRFPTEERLKEMGITAKDLKKKVERVYRGRPTEINKISEIFDKQPHDSWWGFRTHEVLHDWSFTTNEDGSLNFSSLPDTEHQSISWKQRYLLDKVPETGFLVAGDETESFLREKFEVMGLSESYLESFEDFPLWIKVMGRHPYNYIYFDQGRTSMTNPLVLQPAIDTLKELTILYRPTEGKVQISEPELTSYKNLMKPHVFHIGIVPLEWGSEDRKILNPKRHLHSPYIRRIPFVLW